MAPDYSYRSAPSTPTLLSRHSSVADAAEASCNFITDAPASTAQSAPTDSMMADQDTDASRALSEEPSELGEFIHAPAPLTEAQRLEAEEARAHADEGMRRSMHDPLHAVDPQIERSSSVPGASGRGSQRSGGGSGRRTFGGWLPSWKKK